MARDRLVPIRADRGGGGLYDSSYEAPVVGPSTRNTMMTLDERTPNDGFATISAIEDRISDYKVVIGRISDLHTRSLGLTDDTALQRDTSQLDQVQAETFEISSDIRQRIQALHDEAEGSNPRNVALSQHVARLKERFREAIQEYRIMEQGYQIRYAQHLERQFKIVKPNATSEEVRAIVEDPEAGAQIFSNAVAYSNRYGESRAAYKEAQDRHADIKRIERTVEELGRLFDEMAITVAQNDEQIDVIKRSAIKAEQDIEKGEAEATVARNHAADTRKKRIWCFCIILIILAIIAITVAVAVTQTT